MRKLLKLLFLTFAVIVFPLGALASAEPRVKLETNMGDIVIEVNTKKAPLTSENFLKYVNDGFYNGTVFHRVIDGFMIQGGGFDKNFKEKETPYPPIHNESANGLKNEAYTVAMARTSAPHSATAQFFINVKNNSFLNYPGQDGWGYAVFGKVVEGQEVVDKIKGLPTGNRGMHQDVPQENVVIEKAFVLK